MNQTLFNRTDTDGHDERQRTMTTSVPMPSRDDVLSKLFHRHTDTRIELRKQ